MLIILHCFFIDPQCPRVTGNAASRCHLTKWDWFEFFFITFNFHKIHNILHEWIDDMHECVLFCWLTFLVHSSWEIAPEQWRLCVACWLYLPRPLHHWCRVFRLEDLFIKCKGLWSLDFLKASWSHWFSSWGFVWMFLLRKRMGSGCEGMHPLLKLLQSWGQLLPSYISLSVWSEKYGMKESLNAGCFPCSTKCKA